MRGHTKSLQSVNTTHVHDILKVRRLKKYFIEFLSNCLAFSRSKVVNLPYFRQHPSINPRPRRIRFHRIQASESKLRIFSNTKPPREVPCIHLHGIQASNFGHINSPRQLRRIHLYGIQASNFGHIHSPRQLRRIHFHEIQTSNFGYNIPAR